MTAASKHLLVEIGVEELPSSYVQSGGDRLGKQLSNALSAVGLPVISMQVFATPRRLAAILEIASASEASVVRRRGPSVAKAFDANGAPTKALEGFAKSTGVAIENLQKADDYFVAEIQVQARNSEELVADAVTKALSGIDFAKTMRWESSGLRFPRPVRWIVSLLDQNVVDIEMWGLKSDRVSRGLRTTGDVSIISALDYENQLETMNVIADRSKRREAVKACVSNASKDLGLNANVSRELLEEVTDLCEWPVGAIGSFEPELLDLPEFVLTTSMQTHLRQFPVYNADGKLSAHFAVVINGPRDTLDVIVGGNQRVLRARLYDARFFVQEDLKTPLHQQDLSGMTFSEGLGSMEQKTQRLVALSEIVVAVTPGANVDVVTQAASVCKRDLVTSIVFEFPELAAKSGAEYLRRQQSFESADLPAVATAVEQHLSASDDIALEAAALGMADRVDTLVGFIGVGLGPTGSEDPHGLRRAAGEIVSLILRQEFSFDLAALAMRAADLYRDQNIHLEDSAVSGFRGLIIQRLWSILDGQFRRSIFDAVVEVAPLNLTEIKRRCEALTTAGQSGDLKTLVTAAQRPQNIVSRNDRADDSSAGVALESLTLTHPAEQALVAGALSVKAIVESGDEASLKALLTLAEPIDKFFDKEAGVLVMDPDPQVRAARMAILSVVAALFNSVADFSKISSSELEEISA